MISTNRFKAWSRSRGDRQHNMRFQQIFVRVKMRAVSITKTVAQRNNVLRMPIICMLIYFVFISCDDARQKCIGLSTTSWRTLATEFAARHQLCTAATGWGWVVNKAHVFCCNPSPLYTIDITKPFSNDVWVHWNYLFTMGTNASYLKATHVAKFVHKYKSIHNIIINLKLNSNNSGGPICRILTISKI